MDNYTVIIFGATGDLTKRYLLPSLHALCLKKKSKLLVVGVSRSADTADAILERAQPFFAQYDQESLDQLSWVFYYQQLEFTKSDDYYELERFVSDLEQKHGMSGNRLLYLAVAAHFFAVITQHVALSGLAQRKDEKQLVWHRIAYEKPFGHDLQSAHVINQCIQHYFNEHQIYRVDHFLTKEVVSNIALIRFTNIVFEPLWNNRYIDHVQIMVDEKIGIENRGSYYDSYGAVADVMQNHMLELLALIAMEAPEKLTGEYIRQERATVLQKLSLSDGILGQYQGYVHEKGVREHSKTETFAAFCFYVNNPRWAGVPFYLKTGKKLAKKETVIHIKFKKVDCLLSQACPSDANYLTIRIAPDATFSLTLNAKKIGESNQVVPVKMEYCHSCEFGKITPTAYEILLENIVRGDLATSVRFDEIEYGWKIIDVVKTMNLPVYLYQQGSHGPEKELQEFGNKHGMKWRL